MTIGEFFQTPANSNVVKSTIPIILQCRNKTTAKCQSGKAVETIQTAADDTDRTYITETTQYTKTHLGWVLWNDANKATLGDVNANPTKDTKFIADDLVDVGIKIPMVEAILAAQQGTVLPGKKLVDNGSGDLATHPDNLLVNTHTTGVALTSSLAGYAIDITTAIMMCRATTSAATQRIHVAPLW